jgi:DNA-binding response OmpR family regulator
MLTTYQKQNDQQRYMPQPTKTFKGRVLLIDDNQEFLEELKDMLLDYGYRVETVTDSERALAVAYELKPQVIITDLKMSPKSGFQIADEIKHSLQLKDIPVVAMTGFFTEREHVLMMKLCGIKTFILKPFSPQAILEKIEYALGYQTEENNDSVSNA